MLWLLLIVPFHLLLAQAKVQVKPKKLTFSYQQGQLLQEILSGIELTTGEIPALLAIYTPLEQQLAQVQDPTAPLSVALPPEAPHNLLLLLQRIKLPAYQAKTLQAIITQIQSYVPQHAAVVPAKLAQQPTMTLSMVPQQCQLLQELLAHIELKTPEIAAFLAIYQPLEDLNNSFSGTSGDTLSCQLPTAASHPLMVFLQRCRLHAPQAQLLAGIVASLQTHLPAESPFKTPSLQSTKACHLPISPTQAQLLQDLLEQLPLTIEEVRPFMAIYTPLIARHDSQVVKTTQKDTLLLPTHALYDLLGFLQRMRVNGGQAKYLGPFITHLQQLIAKIHTTA